METARTPRPMCLSPEYLGYPADVADRAREWVNENRPDADEAERSALLLQVCDEIATIDEIADRADDEVRS